MRPCTPINHRTPPRESAVKSAPHPAAPVGKPSQTRRHHLTPIPVQRGGTKVPEHGQTFFLFHRARRIFFLMSQKENGGRIPHGQCPLAGASTPMATVRRPTPSRPVRGASAQPSSWLNPRVPWDAPRR